jgi:hypothetical protein
MRALYSVLLLFSYFYALYSVLLLFSYFYAPLLPACAQYPWHWLLALSPPGIGGITCSTAHAGSRETCKNREEEQNGVKRTQRRRQRP